MNQIAIAFFALIAVAAAGVAPIQPGESPDGHAETLRLEQAVNPDSFQYAYETSNGIKSEATGEVKQLGEEQGIVQRGEYSYTGPNGKVHKVTWVADEHGFQPHVSTV